MKQRKERIPEAWSKIRCAALFIVLNAPWVIKFAEQFYRTYFEGGV